MSVGGRIQGGLSKLKKKHFRVKHQKVKLFRASEPLLSVFMWGVNHTVSKHLDSGALNSVFASSFHSITLYYEFIYARIDRT
jgi:hypothetical protein